MENNRNKITEGVVVFVVLLIAAVFVLPWKNVDWGKIEMKQAEIVTVSGEATSQQKNQIATFNVGVNVINDKKEPAVAEANQKINAVTEAVKNFGIDEKDIKTQNLSVYQDERILSPLSNQQSKLGQWRVNTSITITLREVDKASALADLLTSTGANNLNGPNFSFDDTTKFESDLVASAIKNAKNKAENIAKASGRKLGKVVSVVEGSGGVNYYPVAMKAAGGALDSSRASFEPGTGTISKSVTVVFELD
jgi:uncharacterized protein